MGQLLNVHQQHVIVAERSLFEKIHIETSYKQTSEGIRSVLASVPELEQLFWLKVPHHKVTASGASNKCKKICQALRGGWKKQVLTALF